MGTVSYAIIYGCKPPHSKLEANGCLVLQTILEKGPRASATELDPPAMSARHSDTLRPQAWIVQLTTPHTAKRRKLLLSCIMPGVPVSFLDITSKRPQALHQPDHSESLDLSGLIAS